MAAKPGARLQLLNACTPQSTTGVAIEASVVQPPTTQQKRKATGDAPVRKLPALTLPGLQKGTHGLKQQKGQGLGEPQLVLDRDGLPCVSSIQARFDWQVSELGIALETKTKQTLASCGMLEAKVEEHAEEDYKRTMSKLAQVEDAMKVASTNHAAALGDVRAQCQDMTKAVEGAKKQLTTDLDGVLKGFTENVQRLHQQHLSN